MKTSVALIVHQTPLREKLCRLCDASGDFACGEVYGDGESALRRLPAAPPGLVVLDPQLPDGCGITCLAALRVRLPSTRFLVYSDDDDADRIFAAIRAGADGYLRQSTPPAALLVALRELRDGGGPLSADVGRLVLARLRGEDPARDAIPDPLTPRENEVLTLLAAGCCNKEIASRLAISGDTVNAHLKHIYQKLGVRSRLEAVLRHMQGATSPRDCSKDFSARSSLV